VSEGNGVAVANGVTQAEVPEQEVATPRKISKLELKRAQIYQERRQRLINRGVPEEKVDATIAAEDYKELPIEEKFDRFEKLMMGALQGMQRDIMALRHNDGVVAEAMDINLQAMARCLEKAGVSREAQSDIIKAVDAEMREAHEKQVAAQAAAMREQREKQEKQTVEKEVDKPRSEDEAPTPDGATVFGS